uniref:Uncharacterized protein n=1 Tax=Oryza meridionalis TaxID=40149 RepID=A0A0E0D806_9ORYZ
MAMELPPWANKAIDKIRRGFLWREQNDAKGISNLQNLGWLGITASRLRWLWLHTQKKTEREREPNRHWPAFSIQVHQCAHAFFSMALRSRATREATRGHPAAGLLSLASSASPPPEQPPAKPDGGNDGGGLAFYPLQHPAVGAPTGNRRRGGDTSRWLRRHRRPEVASWRWWRRPTAAEQRRLGQSRRGWRRRRCRRRGRGSEPAGRRRIWLPPGWIQCLQLGHRRRPAPGRRSRGGGGGGDDDETAEAALAAGKAWTWLRMAPPTLAPPSSPPAPPVRIWPLRRGRPDPLLWLSAVDNASTRAVVRGQQEAWVVAAGGRVLRLVRQGRCSRPASIILVWIGCVGLDGKSPVKALPCHWPANDGDAFWRRSTPWRRRFGVDPSPFPTVLRVKT